MRPATIKDIEQTIRIGYGGKILGNTSPSFGKDAETNFAKFVSEFPGKSAYDMSGAGQDKIVNIDNLTPQEVDSSIADALITKKPGTLLTLRAADCLPLVFYVPGENILALAHVGTSGANLHLPRKTLQKLGFSPDIVHLYVGPHISQSSYRFEKDKFEKKLDESWDKYLSDEVDGIHIDLLGYVLDELKAAGIKQANIQIEELDTGAEPNYFSHRRHKLTGEPDGRNVFGVCLI